MMSVEISEEKCVVPEGLIQQYFATRKHTEELCAPLNVEDYIPQAAEFASPPKWHIAHVSWFFETMILKEYLPGYEVFDESFHFLFNSYYQTLGERTARADRGLITRPTVDEVFRYRAHVDKHMEELMSPRSDVSLDKPLSDLITLGIQHEQQHQELLITDLKYVFAQNPNYPIYHPQKNLVSGHQENGLTRSGSWIEQGAGMYEIGHQSGKEKSGFCFDNELPAHQVFLPAFEISASLVTNGDYIKFLEVGGYSAFEHWLDEGWSWVCQENVLHPLYWRNVDGDWFYYTLAGLQLIDRDAPICHVNYYEANAYASWKGCRLPTEFEWEVASTDFAWGSRWEWTSSAYQPYPGFKVSEGAVGEYNGKFMVNQQVLRGASCATSAGHSRHTYRNFFHPHLGWQYTGIRLAR